MQYPVATLSEAVRALDPDEALNLAAPEQAQLFVDRQSHAVKKVLLMLNLGGKNTKILFSGHRGNGKSTELSRVSQELKSRWPIHFSANDKLNPQDLDASDLVLMAVIQMLKACEGNPARGIAPIQLSRNLEGRINQLGKEITKEIETSESAELNVKAGLSESLLRIFGLEGRLGKEHVTRKKIREQVEPRLDDFESIINDLTDEMNQQSNLSVVLIIEDLDKGTLEKQRRLFFEQGDTLLRVLHLPVIFTFPIALLNLPQDKRFQTFILRNFKYNEFNGQHCQIDQQHMHDIITKRVEAQRFEPGTIEQLVRYGAGIPRILLRLTQSAVVNALIRDEAPFNVTLPDVEETIKSERRDYQRILTNAQLNALVEIKAQRKIDKGNPLHLGLLDNLSVLEYENGELWYEINPIVEPLIPAAPLPT